MPDEVTNIDDVLIPALWLPYTVQRSIELSVFHQSGIIEQSQEFADLVDGEKGTGVNMPFWNDLTGKAEVIRHDNGLTTKKITSAQDFAAIHNLGSAWAVHDLSRLLSGEDPAAAIGDLVAGFWARDIQARLLSSLKGVFGAGSMSTNLANIYHTSGGAGSAGVTNRFNAESFIDATQLLGDHKQFLAAVAMHSAVHASVKKQGLIETLPDDQGRTIAYFQGLPIVIDDGMPREVIDGDAVYTTYIFGQGAFAMGVGSNDKVEKGMAPGSSWQLEYARQARNHISEMINRRRWILHPRGVKWNAVSQADKGGAEFAELETAANWTRVYDQKNVRVIQMKHNIL